MLDIKLAGVNPVRESLTRKLLNDIYKKYGLAKYTYTNVVLIKSQVNPSSHPVLTLNTLYIHHALGLLSQYLHEQIHWYIKLNMREVSNVLNELKEIYPTVPMNKTRGINNTHSTYRHLIVCFLEYEVLIKLIGVDKTNDTIDKKRQYVDPSYMWVYKKVRTDYKKIKKLLETNHLSRI